MRVFSGWEEFAAAAGTELGISGWHEITQERVNRFADITEDRQWIHVDVARAAQGPYGGTIAHGFLTLSLLPVMLSEVYAVEKLSMAVNYGLNKVRFPAPVQVPARVRASVSFTRAAPANGGFQAVLTVTVNAENSPRPVCVAESVALMVP